MKCVASTHRKTNLMVDWKKEKKKKDELKINMK